MYAVIDLGSNSFHLLIAELKHQRVSVVGRCSEKVQLAENLNDSGKLSPQAMERGLQCLQHFQSVLAQYPIEKIKVVATEAMRRASNADTFTQQARRLGFDVEVISGDQEARWIYNGICGPLPDAAQSRLTIDIGGASTEIALGTDHKIALTESIAVGCVSWRDRFFSPVMAFNNSATPAAEAAKAVLAPLAEQLKSLQWDAVYASSGSAKMLASIGYANNWSGGTITQTSNKKIAAYLATVNSVDEIDLPGLKQQRLDLLAPGLIIMKAIMEMLNIEVIHYSPTALREGILAEMIQQRVDYRLTGEQFH